MLSYDAIVIGSGTNGLAAAGCLAKAGQKVLVLEKRNRLGGGADTQEFAKGYRLDRLAQLLTMLDQRVIKDMQLERHGLRYAAANIATTALSPDGNHLTLNGAYGETVTGALSAEDKAAWHALRARLFRFASLLQPFRHMTPPRLERKAGNELMKLAQIGLKLRAMGREDMQEFLRVLLINVADVLDDELQDDRLKGVIAHDAVLGAFLGPRSPNSLIMLLNRLAGEANGVQAGLARPAGGMQSVADAMAKFLAAHGAELRTGTDVKAVVVENDRAAGVVLDDGSTVMARTIVSAINPRTTLLHLVGARHFDTGLVRRLKAIHMRGSVAKLHLALTQAPDFRGADLKTRLVIAPSVRSVEDAFNAVKYGGYSQTPTMEIILPSAFDNSFAPAGHHVLSANVQFAPSQAEGGWTKAKPAFLKCIMTQLQTYAPGISKIIHATELLTPEDIENEYGLVGGNWHHGELAVEQMLFLRPAPGLAQYETPIANLYLASAGSHPGGGISGAAGWNAAERILKNGGRP